MKNYVNKLVGAVMIVVSVMSISSCGKSDSKYAPLPDPDGSISIHNIMTRTSVRNYTGRQVPKDTVNLMLRAAMAAPSAMNKQPWMFVVLENKDARNALGEAMGANISDKVKTAGAVVVVCANTDSIDKTAPEFWPQDLSAATQNLLLAANAMHLGAVWCGVYPDPEKVNTVSQTLNLPSNLIPFNIITVGYPKAIQDPKEKWDPKKIIRMQ